MKRKIISAALIMAVLLTGCAAKEEPIISDSESSSVASIDSVVESNSEEIVDSEKTAEVTGTTTDTVTEPTESSAEPADTTSDKGTVEEQGDSSAPESSDTDSTVSDTTSVSSEAVTTTAQTTPTVVEESEPAVEESKPTVEEKPVVTTTAVTTTAKPVEKPKPAEVIPSGNEPVYSKELGRDVMPAPARYTGKLSAIKADYKPMKPWHNWNGIESGGYFENGDPVVAYAPDAYIEPKVLTWESGDGDIVAEWLVGRDVPEGWYTYKLTSYILGYGSPIGIDPTITRYDGTVVYVEAGLPFYLGKGDTLKYYNISLLPCDSEGSSVISIALGRPYGTDHYEWVGHKGCKLKPGTYKVLPEVDRAEYGATVCADVWTLDSNNMRVSSRCCSVDMGYTAGWENGDAYADDEETAKFIITVKDNDFVGLVNARLVPIDEATPEELAWGSDFDVII